jgi:hypothetical protein
MFILVSQVEQNLRLRIAHKGEAFVIMHLNGEHLLHQVRVAIYAE